MYSFDDLIKIFPKFATPLQSDRLKASFDRVAYEAQTEQQKKDIFDKLAALQLSFAQNYVTACVKFSYLIYFFQQYKLILDTDLPLLTGNVRDDTNPIVQPKAFFVSEEAKYFAMLCKYKTDVHNFVMLGCVDGGKYHILSAIGKGMRKDEFESNICYQGLQIFFSSLYAYMGNERIFLERERNISYEIYYQGYEIPYAKYVDFTTMANAYNVSEDNAYKVFKKENPESKVKQILGLDYFCGVETQAGSAGQKLFVHSKQKSIIFKEPQQAPVVTKKLKLETANNLSVDNTCRHSSLEILTKLGIDTSKITEDYSEAPPHKMAVENSEIKSPFLFIKSLNQVAEVKADQAPLNSYLPPHAPDVAPKHIKIINQLTAYVAIRANQDFFVRFWGRITGMNKDIKLSSAEKVINILSGRYDVNISTKELKALKDGRLGEIASGSQEELGKFKQLSSLHRPR